MRIESEVRMEQLSGGYGGKSRLGLLLDHFSLIEDDRARHRVAYPLQEVLLLVVCGTIADCDDYEAIGLWGQQHLDFLRDFLPYHHGVPTGRWLTLLMNRINPALFSTCFTDWVTACWPDRPEFIAIDGKTSLRSHYRAAGQPPLHLVSAFATSGRLVLGQEAVADKSSEVTAIPVLLERLALGGGLNKALVSIDAIGCNGAIATAIRDAGADYLLAVKANQPTLRGEIEAFFAEVPPADLEQTQNDVDKGHGRIEQRHLTLAREVDWLEGQRRFPGELRLPDVAAILKVDSKSELKDRCRMETRYYITSAKLGAEAIATAIRDHWGIENRLHWTLDVVFNDDLSRVRKGHGAKNMAVIRHFAINLVRHAPEPVRPEQTGLRRKTTKQPAPKPVSLKTRRKVAGWTPEYLRSVLNVKIH